MSQDNWERLNKETSRIMDERLALFKKDLELSLKELTKTPEPAKPQTGSGEEGHKTLEEQLSCPDCYSKIKKRVLEKEFKEADYKCTTCSLPVRGNESEKEDWECPSCRGKYAKPRK